VLYGDESQIVRVEIDPAMVALSALKVMAAVLEGRPPQDRMIHVPLTIIPPIG
jgi:hypothetical protein